MNYAVIMAGGAGQRLWPLSRKNRPKQIINLFEDHSLLHHCVHRIEEIFGPEQIIVVTNADYADVVSKHLPELPKENIIGEPLGRDTANAIGLAATVLQKRNPQSTMVVFSADQLIKPIKPLQDAIKKAIAFLNEKPEALFTFGIKATFAHVGLGYLKKPDDWDRPTDEICPVEAFKEKPNKSTARTYIRSGKYCWNSGMFAWKTQTILRKLEEFLPHNADRLHRIGAAWDGPKQNEVLQTEFAELEKISIDYAVMEKAPDVYMCELDCHWVDVGSYQALADNIGNVDNDDNATTANTNCEWLDCRENIAISNTKEHLIAAIGVEDIIIVHTEDATLICHREETDQLKKLLERIKNSENTRFL